MVCVPGTQELCYSGPANTATTGLCKAGQHTCNADGSGFGECVGEVVPVPESCATMGDDDCDGMANEEGCACTPNTTAPCYTGPMNTQDVGICKAGTQVCNADGTAYGACMGEITPQTESCLTVEDDDCDGQINEDGMGCVCVPNTTVNCYTGPAMTEGVGACIGGTKACNAQGTAYGPCVGEVVPVAETCNTPTDDDCDGVINESGAGCVCVPNTTGPCYTGPMGTENVGICKGGTHACNAQGTAYGPCVGEILPNAETCNTPTDDDCDGVINEEGLGCVCLPNSTATCYTGPMGTENVGICKGGTKTCNAQGTAYGACMGEVLPMIENCLTPDDENCSGSADGCANGQWSKIAGDLVDQEAWAVTTDGAGNVLVTGYFSGTIDLGGGPLTSMGGTDIFLAKYSGQGVHLWSKSFGSIGGDQGKDITTDAQGNVYITAFANSSIDFGGGILTTLGGKEVCVAKFNSAGVHQWSKRYGGASNEDPAGLDLDSAGNIYVTGTYAGATDFGGGLIPHAGSDDVFLVKLDNLGNHIWSMGFGDILSQDTRDIAVDSLGNVTIVGYFEGTIDFGDGLHTSTGSADMMAAKFTSGGSILGSRAVGGGGAQIADSIAIDNNNNVIISGYVSGTVDFGGGPLVVNGSNDVFVAKYDTFGNHIWSKLFGGGGDQLGFGLAADSLGNIILTGRFVTTIDFGGGVMTSAGMNDIFLTKLSPAGAHIWSHSYGDVAEQWGRDVATDSAGNVVMIGRMQGSADFGQGPLMSAGGYDAFIAKFSP